MIKIRPSTDADLASITAIYEHYVLQSTCTFEVTPPSVEDMAQRRQDVLSKGLPYLVLEKQASVIGFAYCNWFKPRPAYRYSAENSIYLAPQAIGQGLGKLLMAELMAQAERAGIRKLIAVIGDSDNIGSTNLHKSCGFNPVGVISACGWKFERWLDIVLMERAMGSGSSSKPLP
jgi:L-amino acid N-acyltransferase YncA